MSDREVQREAIRETNRDPECETLSVVYIDLPVSRSSTFSCHLCNSGQNLQDHNGLKKHFARKHAEVNVHFRCRQCEEVLVGIKQYPTHLKTCTTQPHVAPYPAPHRSPLERRPDAFSPSEIARVLSEVRGRSSPRSLPSPPRFLLPISPDHAASPRGDAGQHDSSSSTAGIPLPPLPNLADAPDPTGCAGGPGPRGRVGPELWNWEGSTNVLVNERVIRSGTWTRGGGGRQRTWVESLSMTTEIQQARLLLTPLLDRASPELNTTEEGPSEQRTTGPVLPEWNAEFGHPATRRRQDPHRQPGTPNRLSSRGRGGPRGRGGRRPTTSNSLPIAPRRPLPQRPQRQQPADMDGGERRRDDPVNDEQGDNEEDNEREGPRLTQEQKEWLQLLSNVPHDDIEGLIRVAASVSEAAAVRQTDANNRPGVRGQQEATAGERGRGRGRGRGWNPNTQNRRPAPARPRYDANEASSVQKMYRMDRKKAINHIIGDPSPHCHLPKNTIYEHVRDMFDGIEHAWSDPPAAVPGIDLPSSTNEVRGLLSQITPSQVKARLARMTNTAPGPDGARYSGLKRVDPGGHVLAAIYSRCLQMKRVPQEWKDTTTVLIYKAGDKDDLNNWRPLSLGNTIGKLYAAILADRILGWAEDGGRISTEQKGFTNREGCLEHNFVLQEVIEDARRRGEEVCVAWLDLANAFGSVPHPHIFGCLRLLGLPEQMLDVVMDLYDGARTRTMTPEGPTDPVTIKSGVKQGCPLSPIIFNLAMEPMIRAVLEKQELHGYRINGPAPRGVTVNILAYADDLAIIAKNPDSLQSLLDVAVEVAEWCGLQFKPQKCATLHIERRRNGKQKVAPTNFNIQECQIRALEGGQHYRHLGVPTGFRNRQTPNEAIQEIKTNFTKLDESLLAPWQKIDAALTFFMPKLDFAFRGADIEIKPLNELDRHIKRIAKRWLFLPNRASNEPVYMQPSQGGTGMLPLRETRYILSVVQGYRMLTCPDPVVHQIAWNSLRAVVEKKVRRQPSEDDLVGYLNGEGRSEGGPRSFWARVRKSTKELRKKTGIGWHWSATHSELQILVPHPNEEPDVARVHPAARRVLCQQLRVAARNSHIRTLLAKRDQGKVHEVALRWSSSNHMMRTGNFTRFADWRFLHRARLDCVPLNGTKRFGEGSKQCRHCQHPNETLPHVLSCCLRHSTARQLRHHNVVHRLAKAVPSAAGVVREDRRVPHCDSPLRPDIVVIDERSKSLTIVDVAIIFENRYEEFQRARRGKIHKYAPIADEFRRKGWSVNLEAVIVGSLGSWDPMNEPALKMLRISPRYAKLMRRLVVSDTIRWSRDMYVEHITGRRQYSTNANLPCTLPPSTPEAADEVTPAPPAGPSTDPHTGPSVGLSIETPSAPSGGADGLAAVTEAADRTTANPRRRSEEGAAGPFQVADGPVTNPPTGPVADGNTANTSAATATDEPAPYQAEEPNDGVMQTLTCGNEFINAYPPALSPSLYT